MKKSHVCIAGGILGLIATVVTAIYTARKEAKEEAESPDEPDESIFEKAIDKIVRYKYVILLATLTGITFACSVNHFAYQTGCAVTAYKILRKEYDDYVESAKDVLGPKKEDDIISKTVKKEMADRPPKVVSVSDGTTLIYEPVTRTYYEASLGSVQDAEKTINDHFNDPDDGKMFFSFREFLDLLGLYEVHLDDLKTERSIGFHKFDGPVTIKYNVQVMPTGERCVVLMYTLAPRYDFDW